MPAVPSDRAFPARERAARDRTADTAVADAITSAPTRTAVRAVLAFFPNVFFMMFLSVLCSHFPAFSSGPRLFLLSVRIVRRGD